MKRAQPVRIKTSSMRTTGFSGDLLREGVRHFVYRGAMRIGEIEETTVDHQTGQRNGFRPGLTALGLDNPKCAYPTKLLGDRFKTVTEAIDAIKRAELRWMKCLANRDDRRKVERLRKSRPDAKR
jgi:hypothetical protein